MWGGYLLMAALARDLRLVPDRSCQLPKTASTSLCTLGKYSVCPERRRPVVSMYLCTYYSVYSVLAVSSYTLVLFRVV